MNTDKFLKIGVSHHMCEDYVLSGDENTGTEPFIILADGCSGAPNTDWGSRLLVRAGMNYIHRDFSDEIFARCTLASAHTYAQSLQLSDDTLCATLLTLTVEGDIVKTFCCGDGVVAAKDYDGRFLIFEYKFQSGAPYYLRYELSEEKKQGYLKEFGPHYSVTRIDLDGDKAKKETCKYEIQSNGPIPILAEEFSIEHYQQIAIFSDGVSQFSTGGGRIPTFVDLEKIIPELMAFKNTKGEFVKRRCDRAFAKFAENGWANFDDFSMGVINLK